MGVQISTDHQSLLYVDPNSIANFVRATDGQIRRAEWVWRVEALEAAARTAVQRGKGLAHRVRRAEASDV